MSRYIDAEFEIEHYTSITTHPTPDVTEQDKRNSLIILDALRMAKSIDIVRCKECRHWHREINENGVEYVNFSKCTKGHYGNGLDFHCADGERREP